MRKIDEIIIHCSATKAGRHFTASDIDRWHREQGYKMIGYHYVVLLDGTVQEGRPLDMVGAHAKGHNANSIGICYIGGIDDDCRPADTRTQVQKIALHSLISKLRKKYVSAKLIGHCDVSSKACPCFNVSREYLNL